MYTEILKILRGEDTTSELAKQLHAEFPHTDFLCNPKGELVWYQGEYSVEKHREAYERSKKYMPIYKKGKLTWKPHKARKPFYECFSPPKMSEFPKKIPKKSTPKKKSLLIGTVGTYEGEKAVIVQAHCRKYRKNNWVGIGDLECQFKNFGDSFPVKIGPQTQTIESIIWSAKTPKGTLRIDERKFKETNQIVCLDKVDEILAQKKIVVIAKKKKTINEWLKVQIVQEICPNFNVAQVQDEERRMRQATKHVNPYKSLQLAKPDPPCKNCGHTRYINCHTHYVCRKCAVVRDMIHQGLPYRVMKERDDINTCGQRKNPLYSSAWHQRSTVIGSEKLNRMQKQMHHDNYDMQIFAAEKTLRDTCCRLHIGNHHANTALVLFCKFRKKFNIMKDIHMKVAACLFHAVDIHNHKRKRN